jgi:hypothetical protein
MTMPSHRPQWRATSVTSLTVAAATNPVVGSGGARDVQLGLKLTF